MDYLSSHKRILEKAVSNDLPDRINGESEIQVEIVRELVEAGFLKAADASDKDGIEYMEPRITVAGREYLNDLSQRAYEGSPTGKAHRIALRILDWSGGIAAGLVIAWVGQNLL
ncbi:MAG: hypothetical protein MK005_00205 [Alcanivorax sp.]|nr:hypothetical protein [Alcanivorax sp.]